MLYSQNIIKMSYLQINIPNYAELNIVSKELHMDSLNDTGLQKNILNAIRI